MAETNIFFVKEFLKEFKRLVSQNKYRIVDRDKTMETIAQLGVDYEFIKETLLKLIPTDYCSGPEEDRDCKGEYLWIFGKTVDKEEIYIKLKIIEDEEYGKCISFHIAEKKLKYPFKEN